MATKPDHVLFSFHGLPERHLRKSDETNQHCLQKPDCCQTIYAANRNCYRAQCYRTATLLANQLEILPANYTVTFQSRLGRTPWIQPYTDTKLIELAKEGVQRLLVFCPAFVADCLETIEEIGMRAVEDFQKHGGMELQLVPSLNAHPIWVKSVVAMIQDFF